MNVSNSCFKVLFKSFGAGLLSPCPPPFSFPHSFSLLTSPMPGLPLNHLCRDVKRLYTVCFLNHVQISLSAPIKLSNPFGFHCPVQPLTGLEWAPLENCLTMVIYFHYARRKYALFVFVDVLNAHNVWVVNPLREPVNSNFNIGSCSRLCICFCPMYMHPAAEFEQWLHVTMLILVWASPFLCLTHQNRWLCHGKADQLK